MEAAFQMGYGSAAHASGPLRSKRFDKIGYPDLSWFQGGRVCQTGGHEWMTTEPPSDN